MTAPTDHFAAAQIALANAGLDHGTPVGAAFLARAQVHATLAVAEAIGRLADVQANTALRAWDDEQGDDGAAT